MLRSLGKLTTLLLPAVACLAGCGDGYESESGDELGTSHQGITAGDLVTASQNATSPYSSVVYIYNGSVGADCTATKIRQGPSVDTYLTASHCAWSYTQGSGIRIGTGLDSRVQPSLRIVRDVYRHPSAMADPDAVEEGVPGRSASIHSYDIALFTLDRDTSIPARPVDARHIQPGETGRLVSYGCDDYIGGVSEGLNDGFKQTAQFKSSKQNGIPDAAYAHYIHSAFFPRACPGDSGSSLFSGSNNVTGVASFLLPNTVFPAFLDSYFARVANVSRWINDPHNGSLTSFSGYAFIQNRNRQCVRISSLSDGARPYLAECEGYNPFIHGQIWRLLPVSGTQYFQIRTDAQNAFRCFDIADGTSNIGVYTCDNRQEQQWSVVPQGTDGLYYKLRNRATGQVLARDGDTLLRVSSLPISPSQDFLIYR